MKKAIGLIAVSAALLALLATLVVTSHDESGQSCSLSLAGARKVHLDPAQVANARIIVGVARRHSLPLQAAVIAVATAKQESDLHNLRYGDRDSLGLFQQRPSKGWGTRRQILDPVHAASKFYARLLRVPNWSRVPLTVAAQAVQRSAFPDAYQQWQAMAAGLVAGITGMNPSALTCQAEVAMVAADGTNDSPGYPVERVGPRRSGGHGAAHPTEYAQVRRFRSWARPKGFEPLTF